MVWRAEYQDIAVFFFVAALVLAPTALGFALAWSRERRRRVEAERRATEAAGLAREFAQLNAAIDSVAVEVERIGEIERFAVQRLSAQPVKPERAGKRARPDSPNVVTPH